MGVEAQIKLSKSLCGCSQYVDSATNTEAVKLNRPWLRKTKNQTKTVIYKNVLRTKMYDWTRPGAKDAITLAGARRIYEINPFLRLKFPRIRSKPYKVGSSNTTLLTNLTTVYDDTSKKMVIYQSDVNPQEPAPKEAKFE